MRPAALLLSFALAGCGLAQRYPTNDAPSPTAVGAEAEDSVKRNVPPNYRQIVAAEMHRTLKDPYSVRDAEISMPQEGFVGLLNGGGAPVVCARYNAKNSFGGYTGIQHTAYVFRDSRISTTIPNGQACANRMFYPFPEAMQKS